MIGAQENEKGAKMINENFCGLSRRKSSRGNIEVGSPSLFMVQVT
jgi:hypothetical protein